MSSSGVATAGPGSTRVTVDGPGSTMTVYRERAGVAHLQYMVDPVRPWFGRPPWASASLSGNLARRGRAATERRGGIRVGIHPPDSGRWRPWPGRRGRRRRGGGSAHDVAPRLGRRGRKDDVGADDFGGLRGRPGAAPSTDYKSERFGFNPPASAVETRRDVERSILAACGVPSVLANHQAPGKSMREAWRQLTVGTVEPLAVLVADQLSEALGVKVSLTMPRAADVATRGRCSRSSAPA